jgi:hypothetical protein
VLARVAHDLRRGVKAHRLAVQERAGEGRRVVALALSTWRYPERSSAIFIRGRPLHGTFSTVIQLPAAAELRAMANRRGKLTMPVNVTDTRIVDGMSLWGFTADAGRWSGEIELSERFHAHLKEHAVPLDQRAIAHLSNNSLGLDLYTLFAYRLPRLKQNLTLRWQQLRGQLGAEGSMSSIGERIRETLQEVLAVYPDAKIEVSRHGLTMKPSLPSVQKTMVRGSSLRLIV